MKQISVYARVSTWNKIQKWYVHGKIKDKVSPMTGDVFNDAPCSKTTRIVGIAMGSEQDELKMAAAYGFNRWQIFVSIISAVE